MSMITNLTAVLQRIGTEFKSIRTLISGSATGDVSGLTTTATNLVGAINEIKATAGAAAVIDDGATNATNTWSSNKINSTISTAVSDIVASSPAALDTLNELANALGNDANFATSTATALGNRLRVDAAQSLTAPQIAQAQANLNTVDLTKVGADYDTHDFVADFVAALA